MADNPDKPLGRDQHPKEPATYAALTFIALAR
jgi:hypothetical protein